MNRCGVLAGIFWAALGLRAICVGAFLPDTSPVSLRVPFTQLPMDVVGPGWNGTNVPLEHDVEQRAKVTAYVQRSYAKENRSLWFYVGYVGRWSPESIHHPDVCFPGNGFELAQREVVSIPAPGVAKPLRFKELVWKNPDIGGTYTLTTFYYNGKLEPEEWRLRWDSLFGIRYFAIITLSGNQLGSLDETRQVYQDVARRAVPLLLEHFAE